MAERDPAQEPLDPSIAARVHAKQILTNVQQAVWPSMGNAQRFSLFE